MWTRLKLDFWLSLLVVLVCSQQVFAVDDTLVDPEADAPKLVEIEYAPAVMLPYRERRPTWSTVFSFRYENYYPSSYQSEIDQAVYDEVFDQEKIPVLGFELGKKYNIDHVALVGTLSYAQGGIASHFSGVETSLNLSLYGLHVGAWFDSLFQEPYVAPYVQADISLVDFQEDTPLNSASGAGGMVFGWTAGALVQLNWLDAESSYRALSEDGLNNTYLDLFIAQSQSSGGADLSTETTWGAGLKLEF